MAVATVSPVRRGLAALAALLTLGATPGWCQNIRCNDHVCRGTDFFGNPVLLRVESDRTDPTQIYRARIGDDEIEVKRTRSPVVSGGWDGPAVLQRPTTDITGTINGEPVKLHSDSSGLVTGTAFGQPVTCAVDGWSVLDPSRCF